MRRTRLLAAALVAALALGGCGDDDDSPDAAEDTTTTESTTVAEDDTDDTGDTDTDDGDGAMATGTVSVATDDELGEYLVGPDGLTLYLFTADEGTTTACTGACAENWPPLVEAEPTAGEGVDEAELGTAEGIEADQVTYHGHLLYYFAGDEAPGDTNGVGIPEWFAVDPGGEAIEVDDM